MSTTVQAHGGGAKPASIDTSGKIAGGVARRVYGFDSEADALAAGFVCEGGPAVPVALITDAQIASGEWKAEGDPSALVVYTAPSNLPVVGGVAVPVYSVNGWGSAAPAAPTYEFNFDQGSAVSIDDTDPANVRIAPWKTWNNEFLWFAVSHSDLSGQTPHYLIAKANRFDPPAVNENMAVWSAAADTDTWNKFNNQSVGASDIEFYNNAAFGGGAIYISYLPMYPFSRVQRKIAEWALDPLITETSSTTNLIISNATARPNGDGRTAPAIPFYGFKVTSTRHAYTKNIAILTAYNHGNESSGAYQLEGAIDWLIAGSVEAEFLLDYFDIYVYPCLNPQGVYGGYTRSQPQDATKDHNRQWATTGVLECIDTIKTAMNADTGGTIEVGIDFHSSNASANTGYIDSEDRTATLYAAFLAEMQAYEATFGYLDETITTALHYLWQHTYSAKLSIVHEAMCLTSTNFPAAWKTLGQYAMRSLANMLADGRWTQNSGVGSRLFNGTTDRIDFANAGNLSGAAFTVSAWIYRTASGVNEYIVCDHDSGNLSYGAIVNSAIGGLLNVTRKATTDYTWFITSDAISLNQWHHVLATSNGGLLSGSVALYLDGTSRSITFTNGSGAETAHTGSWSLGGRIYSDTRNLKGNIAQVGVWDHVLDATEIANLAAGYAPDLAEATGLLFYFKGNTASLVAAPGGTGTADGTSSVTGVGNGPSIVYG